VKGLRSIYKRIAGAGNKYLTVLMAVLAIVFAVISFVGSTGTYNLRREVRKVQKQVHNRQHMIEKYAHRAINTPDDQWVDLRDLPDDMVIYKYVADTLQSWANQFPISNDEVDAYAFTYRLHYLSNANLFSSPLAYLGLEEQYVNLGSAWYIVNTYISPSYRTKVITGILVKTEYLDDKGLKNYSNKKLRIGAGFDPVSVNVDDAGVVYGIEGLPLFSLVSESPSLVRSANLTPMWISMLFAVLALFLFHIKNRSWLSLLITIIALLAFRVVAFIVVGLNEMSGDIFSPIYYADNRFFDSLGNFLLNNVLVALLAYAVFITRLQIVKHIKRSGKTMRIVLSGVAVLVTFLLVLYIHLTLRSLVINSNIVLEPFRIDELSWYSILAYFSSAMIFLGLLLMLQLLVLIFRNRRTFSLLSWFNMTLYVLVISLYCVTMIVIYGFEKEYEINRVRTNKLAMERDLSLELQLRSVEETIAHDPIIALLTAVDRREVIRSRLLERYLYRNIAHKYNIELTVCSPNDLLDLGHGSELVQCYPFYQDQITRFGTPLAPNSRFYYINKYNGLTSYLGLFTFFDPVSSRVTRLFVEIDSKYSSELGGLPTLLSGDDNFSDLQIPRNYSFARYSNGRIITYRGDYEYPVIFDESCPDGYSMQIKKGYVHFINKFSSDEITLVSRPSHKFFSNVVSFSYIAIFFGLFFAIMTFWGRDSKLFSLPKNSIKRKITIIITSAMIFSILFLGVASIHYISRLNRTGNEREMDEKITTARSVLSEYCKYANVYSQVQSLEFYTAMDELSKVIITDINLYDTHGGLIRTTQPDIYEQFLMGKRMNANAYHEIAHNNALKYTTMEEVAGMKYFSVYAPLFNNQGSMVAIINLPYFSRSADMLSASSSMIATIIDIYLVLIILAFIISVLLSNSLSRPLVEIKERIQGLTTSSNRNRYISYHNNRDEIGVLVSAYNKMVDDLDQSRQQLAQAEREQAWKEMARQIAHEIKNPLTPMKLRIQYLIRMKEEGRPGWEEQVEPTLNSIMGQIANLSEVANAFSSFSRFYNEEVVDVNLNTAISEQVFFFDTNDDINIEIRNNVPEPVVSARKQQLSRVFVNIIQNAIESIQNSQGTGNILIMIDAVEHEEGLYYKVNFEDDGLGVAEEHMERLFHPNFTTKSGGTGLGLAICRNIIEQSQGTISYSRSSLGGACFTILLPAKKSISF
jgi:two-component system nitrogen regulation sensor histidine kinase NtrY